MDELEARFALTVAQKCTPLAQTNLLEHFGCAAAVVGAKAAEISKVPKVNRAGAAVAALRPQVAQRRARFDGLIQRVTALQQELSDRLNAGDSVDDLRERFSELSREVLALNDPVDE